MKKFRFKFDAVLRVRKAREDEALRVLAHSQREYQNELQRKDELKNALIDSLVRKESLATNATSIHSFQLEQGYINGLKQRIIQADQRIFRASKSVEKCLRAYLMAKRQTRVFETLYERAYVEYKKERAKHDQKQTEEMIMMRSRLTREENA
jgi:flagellar export protein FliJ